MCTRSGTVESKEMGWGRRQEEKADNVNKVRTAPAW